MATELVTATCTIIFYAMFDFDTIQFVPTVFRMFRH